MARRFGVYRIAGYSWACECGDFGSDWATRASLLSAVASSKADAEHEYKLHRERHHAGAAPAREASEKWDTTDGGYDSIYGPGSKRAPAQEDTRDG